MAIMYPSQFVKRPNLSQKEQAGEDGEAVVYEVLERRLPANWVVFHSVWRFYKKERSSSSDDSPYANREADFVILIPGMGMVVIEVKNVRNLRVEGGLFYYGDATSGKYPPHKQAHLAAKDFQHEIKLLLRKDIEYRSMAIMLQQQRSVVENKEYKDMYVFGSELQGIDIQKKILNLFKCSSSFSEDDVDRVVRYWWTAHRFETDPLVCSAIIEHAASPLKSLLPALEQNEFGICVKGCAGSGKTWMACKEIARLSRKYPTKRTLFLCYNKLLAEFLQNECRDLREPIREKTLTIKTITSFLSDLMGKALLDVNNPTKEEVKMMCDKVMSNSSYFYDYVFIDEAQDFKEKWWDVVDAMQSNAEMRFYVFCDSNQTLYDGSQFASQFGVYVDLYKNLRNSLDIGTYSNAFIESDDVVVPEPLPFKCHNVEVDKAINDVNERARRVREVLADYEKKYKLKPADVMVLTPWSENNDNNSAVRVEELSVYSYKNRKKKCWSSVKKFKGLERDFIILTDVPSTFVNETTGTRFTDSDLYVACTRAKYGLHIIPMSQESEEKLKKALEKSKNEIEST